MYALRGTVLALVISLVPEAALAWDDQGHRLIAAIAYSRLSSDARAAVDDLLAVDRKDTLTKPDFINRAAWANRLMEESRITTQRTEYNATRAWHMAEIEVHGGSIEVQLQRACYGFRQLPPGVPASKGPAKDCILNKVEQFYQELIDVVEPAEKVQALKFLINLLGDLHHPLHVAQDDDAFGARVSVRFPPTVRRAGKNLREFWELDVVSMMLLRPKEPEKAVADRILRELGSDQMTEWSEGHPRDWMIETIGVARDIVYNFSATPQTISVRGNALFIESDYERRAFSAAKELLAKAGIRLARLLEDAFGKK